MTLSVYELFEVKVVCIEVNNASTILVGPATTEDLIEGAIHAGKRDGPGGHQLVLHLSWSLCHAGAAC